MRVCLCWLRSRTVVWRLFQRMLHADGTPRSADTTKPRSRNSKTVDLERKISPLGVMSLGSNAGMESHDKLVARFFARRAVQKRTSTCELHFAHEQHVKCWRT